MPGGSSIPVPSGSFAEPAEKLRKMVALSDTFRMLTDTSSLAQALERVFLRESRDTDVRPFAVITTGEQHSYRLIGGGEQNWLRPSGSLLMFVEMDTPVAYQNDVTQADLWASTLFGRIADDVAALAGQDDRTGETSHLSITGMQLVEFMETPEEHWKSLGRYFYAVYSVQWGDGD